MKFITITTLFCATISAKCWKSLAPIPSGPRQEHGAGAIDKVIYIVGGLKNGTVTTMVEKYDTVSNSWSQSVPLPVPLHHPNVASVNGNLYVLGALSAADGHPAWNRTYSFDPTSGKWTEYADMPEARGSAAVGISGSKIYLAGGLSARRKPVNTVSMFDAGMKKWIRMEQYSLPEARDHGGGAIIDNSFYVVGGRLGEQNDVRNTTWSLSISKPEKWANVATMPTPRGGIAVAAVGSTIYTFGGEGNQVAGTQGVFPNAESFNVATKSWTRESQMKMPRHGTPAVTVGEWIYIAGGGLQQGTGSDIASTDAYGPGPC